MPKTPLTVTQLLEITDSILLKLRTLENDIHVMRDSLMRTESVERSIISPQEQLKDQKFNMGTGWVKDRESCL